MSIHTIPVMALCWALATAAAAQDAIAPHPGRPQDPLATIDGRTITAESFFDEMTRRAGKHPGQYAEPEQRRALLEALIRYEMLIVAARRAGFDQHPDVVATFERYLGMRFEQDTLEKQLAEIEVKDDDVKAYYLENKERWAVDPRARAALIKIDVPPQASGETRKAAAERAAEALRQARELGPDVEDFGPVARTYSTDRATRLVGGEIGWIAHREGYVWPPAVVDAVFALTEPGQLGPVVETERAFYLVKLVDKKPHVYQPLETVTAGIRHELLRQRRRELRADFFRRLAQEITVEIDEEMLRAIPPPDELRPPAVPTP